jgi:two-component system heavy metal sensor histidine kinase CusS
MNWTFRNRITWINTTTVAILMAIVFACIYAVVLRSSYKHLDSDLNAEKDEVLSNLVLDSAEIKIYKMPEWEEAEHNQLEANPTFIQIVNMKGDAVFSSANLKGEKFAYKFINKKDYYFNAESNGQRLRFGQFAVFNDYNTQIGHLTIAISRQEAFIVLQNLLLALIFSYILLLAALFTTLWFATSRAILPITQLSTAIASINETNLSKRLPLPNNKDEIYVLANTFNELLERLEIAVTQQKQFTADISHEMRTPLTAIKGSLEVLLRRERTAQHYAEKLNGILDQTNRLTKMYDEMLSLSNFENENFKLSKQKCDLLPIIEKSIKNNEYDLKDKEISVGKQIDHIQMVNVDAHLLEIILNNIISNAIKYNKPKGNIAITWDSAQSTLSITDTGIGMHPEHIPLIFNRFYRSDSSRRTTVKGYGLGLAIVQKLCALQNIQIDVYSQLGVGTTFYLRFQN